MLPFSSQGAAFWHSGLPWDLPDYLTMMCALHSSEPTTHGKILLMWNGIAGSADRNQQKDCIVSQGRKSKWSWLSEVAFRKIKAEPPRTSTVLVRVQQLLFGSNMPGKISFFVFDFFFFPHSISSKDFFLRLSIAVIFFLQVCSE